MRAALFAVLLLVPGCGTAPVNERCSSIDTDLDLLNTCEGSRNCTYTVSDVQGILGRVAQCAYTPPSPQPKAKRVD